SPASGQRRSEFRRSQYCPCPSWTGHIRAISTLTSSRKAVTPVGTTSSPEKLKPCKYWRWLRSYDHLHGLQKGNVGLTRRLEIYRNEGSQYLQHACCPAKGTS